MLGFIKLLANSLLTIYFFKIKKYIYYLLLYKYLNYQLIFNKYL